jgi:hypothetical protein
MVQRAKIEWLAESQIATLLGATLGLVLKNADQEMLDDVAWIDRCVLAHFTRTSLQLQ